MTHNSATSKSAFLAVVEPDEESHRGLRDLCVKTQHYNSFPALSLFPEVECVSLSTPHVHHRLVYWPGLKIKNKKERKSKSGQALTRCFHKKKEGRAQDKEKKNQENS